MTRALLGAAAAFLVAAPVALAHGEQTPPSSLARAWSVAPLPLAASVIFLVLFAQALRRLRRRRRGAAALWRAFAAFAAASIALLAVSSPLDTVGEEYLLSGHMLQHVLLADLAPALAALALSGPLRYFLIPKRLLRRLARIGWLRSVLSFALRPWISFALWAASLAVWHVPVIYDAALEDKTVHDLEHLSFVLGGTLIWLQLLTLAGKRQALVRLQLLFAVYVFGEMLAYALIFSFHPYYPAYAAQDERLFGIGPLLDQKLAGLVMMAEQTLTLGLCAVWLVSRHRNERQRIEAKARRSYLESLASHR